MMKKTAKKAAKKTSHVKPGTKPMKYERRTDIKNEIELQREQKGKKRSYTNEIELQKAKKAKMKQIPKSMLDAAKKSSPGVVTDRDLESMLRSRRTSTGIAKPMPYKPKGTKIDPSKIAKPMPYKPKGTKVDPSKIAIPAIPKKKKSNGSSKKSPKRNAY